jgi:CDP-diacylglycerol---serine O-phosphatidyltransferase
MDEAQYLQRRKEDRASRKLRKGMYILPSLFTTANMYLGFYALQQITQGSLAEHWHFDHAAIAIGFAVLFDGLDGRIARMTNTTSEFGRELDSLADVITFGVAPAFLAWMWGFRSISPYISYPDMVVKLSHLGAIAGFAFLVAGASRLARFNITTNPQPSNPGRPGRKYFVGMPIPAGAGVVAAVVHLTGGDPPVWWANAVVWLVVIVIASYLMVSTWRFYSLKEVNFGSRQPSRLIVIFAVLFGAIWFFSRWVLFVLALFYMFQGVFWRLQWVFRRKRNPPPPTYTEASQTS